MLRFPSLFFFFFSLSFCFLFFTFPSVSQEDPFDVYILFIDKAFPSPGETIQASIHANKASPSAIRSVTWFLNGKEQTRFSNSLDFSFISGSSPQQISAQIIFFTPSGQRSYAEVLRWVQPVIFDIFWEGDVVTTPRYVGHKYAGPRTPIILSSKVQFVDREGTIFTEKDFSFRWEIESRLYGGRGPGISSTVYEEGGSLLNRSISVRAFATLISSSSISFDRSVSIPITLPRLLLYPHTLLHGLHTDMTVSKNFSLPDQSTTLSAFPFFFDHSDFQKNTIHYRWFAGSESQPLHEERRVDITVEGDGTLIPLRILAENTNENTQRAENNFVVEL